MLAVFPPGELVFTSQGPETKSLKTCFGPSPEVSFASGPHRQNADGEKGVSQSPRVLAKSMAHRPLTSFLRRLFSAAAQGPGGLMRLAPMLETDAGSKHEWLNMSKRTGPFSAGTPSCNTHGRMEIVDRVASPTPIQRDLHQNPNTRGVCVCVRVCVCVCLFVCLFACLFVCGMSKVPLVEGSQEETTLESSRSFETDPCCKADCRNPRPARAIQPGVRQEGSLRLCVDDPA